MTFWLVFLFPLAVAAGSGKWETKKITTHGNVVLHRRVIGGLGFLWFPLGSS